MLNLRCIALHVISVCAMVLYWSPDKFCIKMIMKCLPPPKKKKPVLPYSVFQIDCSGIKTVRTANFLISISNHKYLDNQTGDRLVKVRGFLTDQLNTPGWKEANVKHILQGSKFWLRNEPGISRVRAFTNLPRYPSLISFDKLDQG